MNAVAKDSPGHDAKLSDLRHDAAGLRANPSCVKINSATPIFYTTTILLTAVAKSATCKNTASCRAQKAHCTWNFQRHPVERMRSSCFAKQCGNGS